MNSNDREHVLSDYSVAGTVLNTLHDHFCCPYFVDKEIEAEGSYTVVQNHTANS